MSPRALIAVCFFVTAACEKDPMAETADLWPGYRRYPTTTLPTAQNIADACDRAIHHFKEEAEKQPGTYVDLDVDFLGSAARNPRCAWDRKAAVTASCRFELAPIYSAPEGSDPLRPTSNEKWTPMESWLVRVGGPMPWIAPRGCTAVHRAAS